MTRSYHQSGDGYRLKTKFRKVCPECGVEYFTNKADKRFCSSECAINHRRHDSVSDRRTKTKQ